MTERTPRHEMTTRPLAYAIPGMDTVELHRVEFRGADGAPLTLDVYAPAGARVAASRPGVVLVTGYPDPGFEMMLGCKWKEMESSIGWARLLAASGIVAITYANREPAGDLDALLHHVRGNAASLGIDAARIGLWASSGNAPLALSALARHPVRCAALLYPLTLDQGGSTTVADAAKAFGFANPAAGKRVEDFPRDVPIFLARAGQDENPGLNDALDRFVARALACDLPVSLVNYPAALHAFDLVDAAAAGDVARQILGFLRHHLGVRGGAQ